MIQLSICIATYNRGNVIAQTLRGIMAQMTDATELLVVDGASPDNTAQVVGPLFAGRAGYRYIRLDEKGGVDQDYAKAIALAGGKYCWLMTDDDVLLPGAVARVLAAIVTGPDLVIGNASVADHELKQTLQERKLAAQEDRVFAPQETDALFAYAGDLLTFIGAVIIRRELWLSRDARKYFSTEFVHVGVIFQSPLGGPTVVLAEPLVRIRYGNALWLARSFEVWMFRWPDLVWSFTHISEQARAAVYPRTPWLEFRRLLDFKARGVFTHACYRRYLRDKPMPPAYRLRVLALAAFPNRLFSLLATLWSPLPQAQCSHDAL